MDGKWERKGLKAGPPRTARFSRRVGNAPPGCLAGGRHFPRGRGLYRILPRGFKEMEAGFQFLTQRVHVEPRLNTFSLGLGGSAEMAFPGKWGNSGRLLREPGGR